MGARKKASQVDQRRDSISLDKGDSCRDRDGHSLQIFTWEHGQVMMTA